MDRKLINAEGVFMIGNFVYYIGREINQKIEKQSQSQKRKNGRISHHNTLYSNDEKIRIVEKFKTGKPVVEIAREQGRTINTIMNLISQLRKIDPTIPYRREKKYQTISHRLDRKYTTITRREKK